MSITYIQPNGTLETWTSIDYYVKGTTAYEMKTHRKLGTYDTVDLLHKAMQCRWSITTA